MKPEQTSSSSNAISPSVFLDQTGKSLDTDITSKTKKSGENKSLSVSVKNDSTLSTMLPAIDGWNSLKPLKQTHEVGFDFQDDVKTALKFTDELEPSLAAMVAEFMVMTLHIMGDLQKAYMEQAINTLKLVQMDMKSQIDELKHEQESNFKKEMTSGIMETVGSSIQLVGSVISARSLHVEFNKQAQLHATNEGPALEARVKNESSDLSTKIGEVQKAASNENVAPNLKKEVNITTDEASKLKTKIDAVKQEADKSSIKFDTPAEIEIKNQKIANRVAYINALGGIFTGAAGLLRGSAQAVQAPMGAEAVGHGISAKEFENTKEIHNSLYRLAMEWVSSTRDAIGRMIATLQEIQKQDALNALASSQKLV